LKDRILVVIYAYCMGCSSLFANIFGRFDDDARNTGRRELKGNKWPRPIKKSGESNEGFLDRMAGWRFLMIFYDLVFHAVINVLPSKAKVRSSFDRQYSSLLLSDAKKHGVDGQDIHSDMTPAAEDLAYSLLMNLSSLMAYIGLLLNSGPNIDKALNFEAKEFGEKESFNAQAHLNGKFKDRYLNTKSLRQPGKLLSEVMSEKGFKEADVLRHAWSVYFQAHTARHPDQFKKMRGIWGQMPPLMLVAFDDRVLHCGAPFPMPSQALHEALMMHFRSGSHASMFVHGSDTPLSLWCCAVAGVIFILLKTVWRKMTQTLIRDLSLANWTSPKRELATCGTTRWPAFAHCS
jgi:hypothetical protein